MRSMRAAASTREAISPRDTPSFFSGNAMLLRTVICGYSANIWNTNAMSR